ncbi:hypothetical protein V2J09_012789 [Rumex salicifolius]
MGEPDEEFEPLFDYKRVQPLTFINIDDDSDSSPRHSPKRRKVSSKTGVEVIVCDDKDEVDDLLLLSPTPMILGAMPKCDKEDTILKELRKRKEELALLAKSAGDVFRPMYESVEDEADIPLQSSYEQVDQKPLQKKPSSERAKIVISIQDKEGHKQFRIYVDDQFERLFKMYSEKVNIGLQLLVFCFDGDKINPSSTPASLGMEDEDIIEVHVKSRFCDQDLALLPN